MPEKEHQTNGRDYSTISASAKSLLLLKGLTNIPFARQAAELMMQPEKYEPDFEKKDFGFWARVVHFENRYWSIDQLLADVPIKNILEISSGFSFRGLEAIKRDGVHYIDTDLPEVIALKKEYIKALQPEKPNPNSKLEVLSLNALDEKAFDEIVSHFPSNEPIVIVNEGLLMYLGMEEKKQLFKTIHNILDKRGGYWITADIYIKQRQQMPGVEMDDKLSQFFEQHKVREQMFESFEAAEKLFNDNRFMIDKKAGRNPEKLSTLKYMLGSATVEQMKLLGGARKIQETWRL